jgi:hypothetical protein
MIKYQEKWPKHNNYDVSEDAIDWTTIDSGAIEVIYDKLPLNIQSK